MGRLTRAMKLPAFDLFLDASGEVVEKVAWAHVRGDVVPLYLPLRHAIGSIQPVLFRNHWHGAYVLPDRVVFGPVIGKEAGWTGDVSGVPPLEVYREWYRAKMLENRAKCAKNDAKTASARKRPPALSKPFVGEEVIQSLGHLAVLLESVTRGSFELEIGDEVRTFRSARPPHNLADLVHDALYEGRRVVLRRRYK